MSKPPDRSNAHRHLVIRGQYPELPEETVILTVYDWQQEVLLEFTLGELKALKRLTTNGH
jgi:hypothetical protein